MAKSKAPAIRDRIVELRRVKASDLLDNPKNWRTHPKDQLAALDGVLKEIGFAGAELAIETPDGLMLIDGHARKKLAKNSEIPVLVTDLTPEEADLLLATFDPIGAMAGQDDDRLKALLDTIQTDDAEITKLLASIGGTEYDPPRPPGEDPGPEEPPAVPITKPGDLWLLGAYWECEDCHKTYAYDEGREMKECPCG